MHATVLDGAVVRKARLRRCRSRDRAGQVVGEGELWVGNPARLLRRLSDAEIERLYYSARRYVKLKNDYLGLAGQHG